MPLQLPPQRSLPDPERMLHEILSDAEAETLELGRAKGPGHAGRTGRAIALVAVAAVAVGVTAVAVPLAVHRQTTTVAADPSSSAPSAARSSAPTTEPSGAVVHPTPMHLDLPLKLGQRVTFDHLAVTAVEVHRSPTYGILVRAKVCVLSLPPNSGSTVKVSWAPWSVSTLEGRATASLRDTGLVGAPPLTDTFPDDTLLGVGACASGWIPFNADEHSASVTVHYADQFGDEVSWGE